MPVRLTRVRWLLLGVVGLTVAGGIVLWVRPWKTKSPPSSASPYLNTGPEARYIGSEACHRCHEDRRASFRDTGMGRSMAKVDLAREPPDAAFDHPPSKRRYQVVRKDGRLWHRELLLGAGPPEVVLAEYPVSHVVGSGRHSLTYVAEAEGFLVESPITWYRAKKAWGMSPGYDAPDQPGFERAVGDGCLACHAGRSEAVGASLHRMHVHEPAIACERCHGPGSLHAERHAASGSPTGAADFTIVNPSRLDRQLAEAICQQCHLRSTAMIPARGRSLADFRPGLPLQDVVHAFMLEAPDRPMTVVGHVEQMHLSRCYQASDSLTCLTCHDPHAEPRPENRVAHYKAACLGCHQPERCTVPAARRERESPNNDCVHCHMPQSPTEIPHLAFTHHRIGVHGRPAAPTGGRTGGVELRPFLDLDGVGPLDRKRSLGLAYLEAANREKNPEQAAGFRERTLELLTGARAAGLRDGAADAGLARLRFDLRTGDALSDAINALSHPDLAGQDRCNALFILADGHALARRHAEAVKALEELTRLRRHSVDWLLLADCHRALGDREAGDLALETAVRISPRLWKVHKHLADQYARKGNADRAEWHRQRAVP